MKQLTKAELAQIDKSVELIMQAIKSSSQDLGVMLNTLQRANAKLEANILHGTPIVNPKSNSKKAA